MGVSFFLQTLAKSPPSAADLIGLQERDNRRKERKRRKGCLVEEVEVYTRAPPTLVKPLPLEEVQPGMHSHCKQTALGSG
ncbi:hypothetical protein AMECASPLE_010687 [Ameca splendens]|uniref:Uncharacterized protein n=1 Tax=Ameca splendens TaxID=208324 RepID=A0ABV0XDL1_9TELE